MDNEVRIASYRKPSEVPEPAPSSSEGAQIDASAAEARRPPTGMSRRMFVAGFGGTTVLVALGAVRLVGDDRLVRPPGGQDYATLVGRCLRCGKCMEVCPQQVIVMANIEKGILSQRTPQLSFKANYCNWCEGAADEPLCTAVCPTAALELEPGSTARNTIVGKAEIDTTTCLAYRDIGCRFCYDACPYDAMSLDANNRPVVKLESCNGCGACEAACVSLQNGSISSASKERAIVVRALDANGNLVNSFENGGGVV